MGSTIYTSYYGNKKLKTINPSILHAISVSVPNSFGNKIKQLAPSWSIVSDYRAGRINWERYTVLYTAQLEELGVETAVSLLQDGHIYLCYEKRGDNCHRHILADWIMKYTDITVMEL